MLSCFPHSQLSLFMLRDCVQNPRIQYHRSFLSLFQNPSSDLNQLRIAKNKKKRYTNDTPVIALLYLCAEPCILTGLLMISKQIKRILVAFFCSSSCDIRRLFARILFSFIWFSICQTAFVFQSLLSSYVICLHSNWRIIDEKEGNDVHVHIKKSFDSMAKLTGAP